MNTQRVLGSALVSLLFLAPAAVSAAVLTVAPSQAVICPADESGTTKVVLQFDLSGIRRGEGRVIDEALLDWAVTGVVSNRHTEYSLHVINGTWTTGGVSGGTVPAFDEEAEATWGYDALDYQRNQGGLLRFNMTGVVRDWLSGETENHGVMITTEDLSRTGLADQLAGIRLTIRYGFVPQ